jgi:hypothetical protein
MKKSQSRLSSILLLAAFAIPLAGIGCAEHTRNYRAYDPYHNDYHQWSPNEDTYYRQWYGTNYHDQYRDYRKLNKDEQKRYWDWRHNQQGHDHDRDHDRDRDHDHDHDHDKH